MYVYSMIFPIIDDSAPPDIILNKDLLEEYKVNLEENAKIKAGDVLTVAKPFVSVLATSCRGKRCECCFLEKELKITCKR